MSPSPWIPSSNKRDIEKMLSAVGIRSVEELFKDIPEQVRLKPGVWDSLDIGFGRELSEIEVRRIIDRKLSRNKLFNPPPFMGGGAYPHYVPPLVKYILSRGEFLTAYTPYQAEISQGLMQALFEYQSLVAELLEMDVVNASMYDWASAIAEAALMSLRVKRGRSEIILPVNMNPLHKKVVETYLYPHKAKITYVKYDPHTGMVDIEDLKSKISTNTASVYLQYPNFFGIIEEEAKAVAEIAHEKEALAVMGVYPISLGLLKPPGELGADIAVGDGQSLGLGLNYGGPHLGIFATKYDQNLIRQMPGRIIGLTTTVDGSQRAFAMILQTREQHIKREKATSNICTNEALMAVAAAVYLSLLGPSGIRRVAEVNYYRAHYAHKKLKEAGFNVGVFKGDFFNEFPVSFNEKGVGYQQVHEALLSRGIHGGLYIGKFFPELGETVLFAFTEMHFKEDIDNLVSNLVDIAGDKR